MNRRTPSSPATEPMSAPTAEADEWAAKIMELAHRWAQATYCKGQGRPFEDFDAIQIEMCSLLATPPGAATEPSDAERLDVTVNDVYTLIGHAEMLAHEGQTDMPQYLHELAARLAAQVGDPWLINRTKTFVDRATKGGKL